MHFDDEAVSAYGNRRAGKRKDLVALSSAMARVDQDWQVTTFFYRRHNCKIESVARKIRKGANAAFAEHHVVIAFGQNVFGGHQEFVEGGGHAALQQNGLFRTARPLEEREILHIAGANLDHVGVFFHQVERFVVDGLGDDAESEGFADLGKNF